MMPAWRILFAVTLLCGLAGVIPIATGAAGGPGAHLASRQGLRVSISQDHGSQRLGRSFSFRTSITNTGARAVPNLVEHLNIASLEPGVYVDPEDWSSNRTQYRGSLLPGQSISSRWTVDPVNGGHFAIYVAAFPGGGGSAPSAGSTVSPLFRVQVAEHRTLNPGGVLPLAVAIPGILGLLALGLRLRRRI